MKSLQAWCRNAVGMAAGLGCLAAVAAGDAAERLFDFGKQDSAVRPGFTQVTAHTLYTSQQGYGWVDPHNLQEQDKDWGQKPVYNASRKRSEAPPIYTNEITRDALLSRAPNTFRVDLPDGAYRLYLLCGVSDGPRSQYYDFTVKSSAVSRHIRWPGNQWFQKELVDVRAEGGRVELRFEPVSLFAVNAVCLYPAAETRVRDQVLAPLEKEIYFLPPKVSAKWKEIPNVETRTMPAVPAAARQRGYALWTRSYLSIVYPNTVPLPEELSPDLKLFASLGEYEPTTLVIRPFRDLDQVRVQAGALAGPGGAVIPAAEVEVRWVRYCYVRPNYSIDGQYKLVPDVLMPNEPLDLAKDVNQRYWVTVHVPEDAVPGMYTGALQVVVPGGEGAAVPLTVRVLPIRLRQDPDKRWGLYYRYTYDRLLGAKEDAPSMAYLERRSQAEVLSQRQHGMDTFVGVSASAAIKAWGNAKSADLAERVRVAEWDFDRLDKVIRHYLDNGFLPPIVVYFPAGNMYRQIMGKGQGSHGADTEVPPQEFFDAMTTITRTIEAERAKRNWPVFAYYPTDEPSSDKVMVEFMKREFEAIRAGGGKTYVTADPAHAAFHDAWKGLVDIWCCQPFTFAREKIQQLAKEENCEFWCYPNHTSGENDHTVVAGSRITFGFGFWRSGFRVLVPWIFSSINGDPFNSTDGAYSDFMNRETVDGDVIPAAHYEAYREGIDDHRYVYTLESLIREAEQAEKRGVKDAAVAAKKDLQFVWDSIPVMEKYKYEIPWHEDEYDVYRWILARNILRLQEALK